MRYLMDVNALVAFGHTAHLFHARVVRWAASVADDNIPEFATSPITELGFVRIMSQAYGATVIEAQSLLSGLIEFEGLDFKFIADNLDASCLPAWVNGAKQTTDGHLLELAKANGCILATLDERIPDAFLIPE
ncbi:type II toxin-antitoxin system VapC family toxin [soil metagenome]